MAFKDLKIFLGGTLGAFVLTLLNFTIRWRFRIPNQALSTFVKQPAVIVFWHDCQLLLPFGWFGMFRHSGVKEQTCYTLISGHGDGRIIATAIRFLGLGSVKGSSTRGSREGARELIEKIHEGKHICVTPDGPRGPRHKAKVGAVRIASKTGAPLYAIACASTAAWVFNSWDRMFLPKPFSKMVLALSEPLQVPGDLTDEDLDRYVVQMEMLINSTEATAQEATRE